MKFKSLIPFVFFACLSFSHLLYSAPAAYSSDNSTQTFSSGQQKTHLLELYSSQGCSSCPPAERWISRLTDSEHLWSRVIPVVFHVDYWNYLGWRDPYSKAVYSERQREYHHQNALRSVYTPGFVLDGEEWRQWIYQANFNSNVSSARELTATLFNNTLHAQFPLQDNASAPYRLNVALLGFGLKTDIQAGENSGRAVTEDFVVLNLQSQLSTDGQWNIKLQPVNTFNATRLGLAIWVNTNERLAPLQATGGWIQ